MSNSIDIYNDMITCNKYFSIEDAINAPIKSKTVFIIANETITKHGNISRYYTVFPSFKKFIASRDSYPHCHEIFIDHKHNKTNIAGRLVFDFDIKKSLLEDNEIPSDFKSQIENTIYDVIDTYFVNVEINRFEFIWSTSQNPDKFSKHLTVKNLYFDDWISMSKIFYQLFCNVWDSRRSWIKSSDLIDFQIVRKRASLRMVGSSKIVNGYPLVFDNIKNKLVDSLIKIYYKSHREREQLITKKNIHHGVFSNEVIEIEPLSYIHQINITSFPKCPMFGSDITTSSDKVFDDVVYHKAYELHEKINPGIFKMGKIKNFILPLTRIKPSKCLMSGKMHEHENAFLTINVIDDFYHIRFGCYRRCHEKKTIHLGQINISSLDIYVSKSYGYHQTFELENYEIN